MTGAPTQPLPASASLRLRPGDLFAERFAIEAILGEGGMGAVYRVLDAELDEAVALKLLRPEWAQAADALDRFRREVKLARRVTHPNVARTYDLGAWEGVRYMTMELIGGEPLSKQVGQGRRIALPEVLRIGAEIAKGLAAAHAAGVVHRDLKPDNVMIDDQRVVITDFGIARLAEGAVAGNATRTIGSAIGTPAYMAPEQVEGRELDGRADTFALGIVLYEALTGELPFVGETVYALAAARLAGNFPDPRTKVPGLPDGVAELLNDALARRREQRPDAQAFLRRLEELRGARVGVADPTMHVPMSTPIRSTELVTPSGPRTVAVLPLEGAGFDLVDAIADSLAGLRGLRVLPPSTVRAALAQKGAAEATAIGKLVTADVVIEGSLRVSGNKARVRMRMVDVASGAQQWAERWEGAADAPFALEDEVVQGTSQAIRARLIDDAGRRGPSDPEAREVYRRARQIYASFDFGRIREAIELLRGAHASWPNDPWITSALGAALCRYWALSGGDEPATIAEAEELSLRALSMDGTIGETYDTIGVLRLQFGETRAAVRAFQEAIARSPLLAEAHEYLGRLLCECGYTDEGMRRLDLAVRLEPSSVAGHFERARTHALLGDRARAEACLSQSLALAPSGSAQVFQRARLALWWRDRDMLVALHDDLVKAPASNPLIQQVMLPLIDDALAGRPLGPQLDGFRVLAGSTSRSPRQRAFFVQLTIEMLCYGGRLPEAIEALGSVNDLPLVDILWLDGCPVLAALRDDPAFARARAIIAARAAEAFS